MLKPKRGKGFTIHIPSVRFPSFGSRLLSPPRRRRLAPYVWPAIIIMSVLVLLRQFAFEGKATNDSIDTLAFWYPNFCFLGRALRAGHIPGWNPTVMGGVPFAADPQTGWGYLLAMILFSVLPCSMAIGWFLVLPPILGGLGTYWFLRSEGLSRPASGAAGLVLAMVMTESSILTAGPIAGVYAFVPLMLAAASRYLRAPTWSSRLAWGALVALGLGQVTAAFLREGLVFSFLVLGLYLGTKLSVDFRSGRRSGRDIVLLLALLALALPLVNMAYLLPRLAYIPRTTQNLGYRSLQVLQDRLAGRSARQFLLPGSVQAGWPLAFVGRGAYLGAAGLAVALAGWRHRRLRALFVTFLAFAFICYIAGLGPVVHWANTHFGLSRLVSFYLHEPEAFRFGTILAFPFLIGIGVESLREAKSAQEVGFLVASGLVVWWGIPLVVHEAGSGWSWFLSGAVATCAAMIFAAERPRILGGILAGIVALELIGANVIAQIHPLPTTHYPVVQFTPTGVRNRIAPNLDAAAYLRAGPIVRTMQAQDRGRYYSARPGLFAQLGYLGLQMPEWWGFETNNRSTLFGLEDIQVYNPVQPLRFWEYVHTVSPEAKYSLAYFIRPRASTLNLLQVAWVVTPSSWRPPFLPLTQAAAEGPWRLYAFRAPSPRASVMTSWTVAGSSEAARAAVTEATFDPASQLILEGRPNLAPAATLGSGQALKPIATYRQEGPQAASVDVFAPAPAIVLIRNSYDPGWRATVDGHSAEVLPADYLVQGVPVPPGRHVVRVFYNDPSIGAGIALTFLSLAGFLGSAFVVSRRRRIVARGRTPIQSKQSTTSSEA